MLKSNHKNQWFFGFKMVFRQLYKINPLASNTR